MSVNATINLAEKANNTRDIVRLSSLTGYTWGSRDFSVGNFIKERNLTGKYLKAADEITYLDQVIIILMLDLCQYSRHIFSNIFLS
ncbi:hypothetical protein KQI42_14450 [Tissierella sp. MSJ-40]|uniref:Uncharacterized protein n=1 Tax=Tissierella simiarum TaxID=2841534 RepID=A0ABS6E8G1_9FIRM|nr:hypothetical protein [Tissierella simiarum]MBU5439220.1 hypothetical protein [Tissierella simiarum]